MSGGIGMRLGKLNFPTGVVGVACVGAGLALSFSNFAVSNAQLGEALGASGAIVYWAGWAFFLVWLINGYRHRVTLRHTLRVAIWALASFFLFAAFGHVFNALSAGGLAAVSPQTVLAWSAASIACIALGHWEWRRSRAKAEAAGGSGYDDWLDLGGIGDFDFDAD